IDWGSAVIKLKANRPMTYLRCKLMNVFRYSLPLLWCLATTTQLSAADQPSLKSHLEPFRPLIEKTWKGAFKNSKKPTTDVMRWERALNGKAIRVLHSVNDGSYGGETIFR